MISALHRCYGSLMRRDECRELSLRALAFGEREEEENYAAF
jgi:hypothetical protein